MKRAIAATSIAVLGMAALSSAPADAAARASVDLTHEAAMQYLYDRVEDTRSAQLGDYVGFQNLPGGFIQVLRDYDRDTARRSQALSGVRRSVIFDFPHDHMHFDLTTYANSDDTREEAVLLGAAQSVAPNAAYVTTGQVVNNLVYSPVADLGVQLYELDQFGAEATLETAPDASSQLVFRLTPTSLVRLSFAPSGGYLTRDSSFDGGATYTSEGMVFAYGDQSVELPAGVDRDLAQAYDTQTRTIFVGDVQQLLDRIVEDLLSATRSRFAGKAFPTLEAARKAVQRSDSRLDVRLVKGALRVEAKRQELTNDRTTLTLTLVRGKLRAGKVRIVPDAYGQTLVEELGFG